MHSLEKHDMTGMNGHFVQNVAFVMTHVLLFVKGNLNVTDNIAESIDEKFTRKV